MKLQDIIYKDILSKVREELKKKGSQKKEVATDPMGKRVVILKEYREEREIEVKGL